MFYVSAECFFTRREWLQTGYAISKQDEYSYKRDYMLMIPSSCFESVVRSPATYTKIWFGVQG
eukprot:1526805-Karenia_brevis.AAC.1